MQLKSKSRPIKFQHAAARRRLDMTCSIRLAYRSGFNTQPPVGGWLPAYGWVAKVYVFQHAAARRRLAARGKRPRCAGRFQHAAARRRLGSCAS